MNNFKVVKYLKIEWLKNITKECGAMQYCIDNIKDDKKNVIWHNSEKYGNMWTNVNDKDLLRLTEKDNGIYEVIYKYPHKVYFDIDADNKDYDILKKITPKIKELFKDADICISGSKAEVKTHSLNTGDKDKDEIKTKEDKKGLTISTKTKIRQSYHITLNNYLIKNDEDRQKIKALVKYLRESFDDSFDDKVYSNNRNMKCINQSKGDNRTQEIKLNQKEKKHFINAFIDSDKCLTIPLFNDEVKLEIEIDKVKNNKLDLGAIPKLTLKEPDNFDINDFKPIEALNILPLDKNFNHDYTQYIARYCFYNEITFEEFYKWYKNKNESIDAYNKWKNNWNNLSKFPKVELYQIKILLIKYYPKLYNKSHYNKFESLFDIGNTIKVDELTQDIFNTNERIIAINANMGKGKTYQTSKYLMDKENFIWITPNISLAQNTKKRLNDDNIKVSYYSDVETNERYKKKKLMICLNSLQSANDKYKIVIIDEIETVLKTWFNNDTLKKNKKGCWEKFITILNNADKVILLDAFTTKITIDFIKCLKNPSYNIYESYNLNVDRTINMVKNFESWSGKIINDLKANKKLFIYYPYKDSNKTIISMESFKELLEKETNTKGICYHSKSSDATIETLEDVNEHWVKYDFVMTNNKITVGVNFEKVYFDSVYSVIAGFNSPRDIIQVSYRCRQLKTNNIYVCYINTFPINGFKNDNDLVDNCNIYNELSSNILIEKLSPLKDTFIKFCNLAYYKISKKEEDITEELHNYISELFDNVEATYTYKSIKDINKFELEELKRKEINKQATMDDKMIITKYYYKQQFIDETKEEIEQCWDNKYIKFIEKVKSLKNFDLFEEIKEYNKWESIFPTDEELSKNALSDELRTRIFKEFYFKDLTITSSTNTIIKNLYQQHFNKQVIKTIKKHQTISDEIKDVYKFCMDNLKVYDNNKTIEMIDDIQTIKTLEAKEKLREEKLTLKQIEEIEEMDKIMDEDYRIREKEFKILKNKTNT